MDETDGWLLLAMVTGLAASLLLALRAIKALQEDVALLRITAAVPEIERHG